jgi:hypothetical protein
VIRSFGRFGVALPTAAEIKFPQNLTRKMAADARKEIKEGIAGLKEVIAGLRKLDARLAAYKREDDAS